MYLRKIPNKKNNRVFLVISQGTRVPGKKNPVIKTVKALGYLDELVNQYDDPIAHFTEIAKQMNEEGGKTVTAELTVGERPKDGRIEVRNLGYAPLLKIYRELEIDVFLNSRQRSRDFMFSADKVMQLLVLSRLLYPGSKRDAYLNYRDKFFEKYDFSIDDMYRSLSFFSGLDEDLQTHMHRRISQRYSPSAPLAYYDVTNYYFEIDKEDELRRNGVGKENRPNPIIQMGLFMDADGIPVHYDIFPGNTNDMTTFRPMLGKIAKDYDLGRIVVVADRGVCSGDNIYYTLSGRNGYIISYSVRKSDKAFRDYVLDESGYIHKGDDGFKIKSRTFVRDIAVTGTVHKKITKNVDEKIVVFYSSKYAEKAKAEREAVISKAMDIVANPGRYTRATAYGACRYVRNLSFNTETGEVIEDIKRVLGIDHDAIAEDERLDGYYAIITSETGMSDDEIINAYRGLWRIEETFKITKSELQARPVYLSRLDHIRAHFLTCFVALTIARLLEKKMGGEYTVSQMLKSLRQADYRHETGNIWLMQHADACLDDISRVMGTDLTKERITKASIKNILAEAKKGSDAQHF
jgi:hypothetical protein